ncbi:phage tail length tape measure family protein [Rhizobium leucaenae]|uniref:phage tail length tape measure family protein n=1 Tax=Rhizobium leucaenae TaxID=29450 RepID=UPI000A6D3BFE|nr:phage tail length tape measure family protein [Rhizobium leucaenae]
MTVALSSLRVGAEVDAGKYTAGMAEKVAADKAGAASSVAVGEALTATNTKISQSGDLLTRLRRQYVDGAANAQRFEAAITTLGRGIERGAVPLNQVSTILDGIYQKYQLTADAAALMERGQVDLAKAVEAANAKLKQQSSIAPANQNARPTNNFQATNVAYQLQDIFSTAALGSSPLTVALQQGPQLASVFGETGAAGAVKTLGSAFLSLISPVSLITIGLTGLTAAAIQYFTSTGDQSKKVETLLAQHAANIRAIKDAYGVAAEGLKEYVSESNSVLAANNAETLKATQDIVASAAESKLREALRLPLSDFAGNINVIDQFRKAINDLRTSIANGRPDILAYRDALSQIAISNEASEAQKKLANELRGLDDETLKAATSLPSMRAALSTIGGTAASQVEGVAQLTSALRDLAKIGLPALTDAEQAEKLYDTAINRATNREQRDDAYNAYQAALQRVSDQNPIVINSDGRPTKVPTPQSRPLVELEGLPGADKLAKSSQKSADAYRDVIKSAKDRIDQMQLEATTAGETGIAAETLTFKLKLLQDATDKGRTVTAAQRTEIEKLAEAYRSAATAASEAKLQQDIQFQQRQLGRSSIDQSVAGTLRQYGLPEDLNSYDAQLIRSNEQLKLSRDLAGDFASTLSNGLRQGEGLWKSFGDAATSVLSKISDMLLNDVLNAIFQVKSAGGSGGGGFLSGLFGLFGGGSSSGFDLGAGATAFTGTQPFAAGGIFSNSIVSRPTLFPFASGTGLMGEAGPEAIMPLRRDASGRLGVSGPSNDNRASASSGVGGLHVSLGVAFDQDEGFRAYVKDVAQTESNAAAKAHVKDYDQQMPARVAQINLHPRRR